MPDGITRVALDGRMDIAGAAVVDLKMNIIAGSAKKLLIDLQKVEFLGSMGLRSIVIPARVVNIQELQPGGQRIRLMRKFASRLAYQQLPNGNRLTLAFAIPPLAIPLSPSPLVP